MPKYLDKTGLVLFKSKIDATYATPNEIIHPDEVVAITNTEINDLFVEGYTITLNCGGGSSYTKGNVHVYDSTYADRSSSNLIFSQDSIDLSAYPAILTVKSGYCTVSVESSGAFMGSYLRSSDFTDNGGFMTKEFVVDKNGTIEFGADDWDD